MIKESKVLLSITNRNISSLIGRGYDVSINTKHYIKVIDLAKGSTIKVTAICDICFDENLISYNKYIVNFNRNNKGYYSCFKCKNIEKEKTCISKYGVKSYSMTSEFKKSESAKWKGIQKGSDKIKVTCLERYGVDNFFKTDKMREMNRKWMSSEEFINKSKETLLIKYDVDHFSKSDEFKRIISNKRVDIVNKIKNTILDRYGVDWISKTNDWKENFKINKDDIIDKIKSTCLDRYGFDNVSKVEHIKEKTRETKISKNQIVPDNLLNEWLVYKRDVRRLTKRVKLELFENWDGYDYYDGEFIKNNLSLSGSSRLYPTIDHKVSTYFGFINNIEAVSISELSNLCITKRYINSMKGKIVEKDFTINN